MTNPHPSPGGGEWGFALIGALAHLQRLGQSISELAGYISSGGTGYGHSLDFECYGLSFKTISYSQNVAIVFER